MRWIFLKQERYGLKNETIELIARVSDSIDHDFWQSYLKHVDDFPDTEDGAQVELYILQIVITLLASKYILSFEPFQQDEVTNKFLHNIRMSVQLNKSAD